MSRYCVPTGGGKSATKRTRRFRAGIAMIARSPSAIPNGSERRTAARGRFCGTMPARAIASQNARALPSTTGISGPSTRSSAFAMPHPISAERTCSTVETVTPSRPRTVAMSDSIAYSAIAGIRTPPETKTYPVSGGAGAISTRHSAPVWRPTPEKTTEDASVACSVTASSPVAPECAFECLDTVHQLWQVANEHLQSQALAMIARRSTRDEGAVGNVAPDLRRARDRHIGTHGDVSLEMRRAADLYAIADHRRARQAAESGQDAVLAYTTVV